VGQSSKNSLQLIHSVAAISGMNLISRLIYRNMGGDSSNELQIIHTLQLSSLFCVPVGDFSSFLIEEQPLQRQQRADHVFAHPLCLSFGLGSDLTVDIEACVVPAENLLYEGEPDELFLEKQREDLTGEENLDMLIMEAGDMVEGAIRGCASFCDQDMEMEMEIEAISEGLDNRNNSRHQLLP